jgi:hypothetical protein
VAAWSVPVPIARRPPGRSMGTRLERRGDRQLYGDFAVVAQRSRSLLKKVAR